MNSQNFFLNVLKKSELAFLDLELVNFEEKSPGRFFQKEKLDLYDGFKQFIVILAPNVESPIHNHKNENMSETHLLLWGSGKFIIYNEDGSTEEMSLVKGKFHKIFTTPSLSLDHKYVAGAEGSVTLALEKYY